jgi:hypothetical protein
MIHRFRYNKILVALALLSIILFSCKKKDVLPPAENYDGWILSEQWELTDSVPIRDLNDSIISTVTVQHLTTSVNNSNDVIRVSFTTVPWGNDQRTFSFYSGNADSSIYYETTSYTPNPPSTLIKYIVQQKISMTISYPYDGHSVWRNTYFTGIEK